MTVLDAIRNRRSVRAYDARPIPAEVLKHMKEALRLAPSACNFQPWRFVLVRDGELRRKIAASSCGQLFVAQAPVLVVGIGLPEKAFKNQGGSGNSIEIDLAIALDHLSLAAAEEGLGTCWIGAFDEAAVKRLIGAREGEKIVAMMPLGYPADPAAIRPAAEGSRKPESELFSVL